MCLHKPTGKQRSVREYNGIADMAKKARRLLRAAAALFVVFYAENG